MSEVKTFKCDAPNCKNTKKDANGWFRAKWGEGEFHIYRWDKDISNITGLSEGHFCSESCAVKVMSKKIGSGRGPENQYHPAQPILDRGPCKD